MDFRATRRFGDEVWGRTVGGKAKLSIQSLSVDNLSRYQCEMMCNVCQTIMDADGTHLSRPELVKRIANSAIFDMQLNGKDSFVFGGYVEVSSVKVFMTKC